ncbi:MAG TPA: hypothetical protein VGQ18_14045 [Gemmatimonadales bacterium]|jgi:hypothetical protein|nr:hypothetical protein [Gemmatimonadales bacterium]
MFCKDSVTWLYRLERNYSWDSGHQVPHDLVFRDKDGTVRLLVETSGRITVMRGYCWNGCSPKFCVFDILIGTPDGVVHARTGRPKAYYASLVHDALYQFLLLDEALKRRHADGFFLRLMGESSFAPRYIYWVAVRTFGWLVWLGKKRARSWAGTREAL